MWDTKTEEWFELGRTTYDIRAAKQILAKKKHKVMQLPVAGLEGFAKMFTPAEATSNVDFKIPVILITTASGKTFPVDGWHRIKSAIDTGMEEVPAVVLNPKETAAITMK